MADRLHFGTAGLRAPLGDGPLSMNVQTIEQVARAVAQWLPEASTLVIGRDARYGSGDFANVTARVLAEAGHDAHIFVEPVPTPVVAHEVVRIGAAGGVMVTASHNPATDNGYKVYAADGGQILLEDAALIEALMAAEPWPDSVDVELPDSVTILGSREIELYLQTIDKDPSVDSPGLTIAYTAMHGVGGDLFVRALNAAGHVVHSVPEQHEPDPDFPTAPFPNPEESGTLDLVIELADEVDADIILANDPDADRLAVAVQRGRGWERLTGDEIGVLLGSSILDQTTGSRSVATTIVSSSLLSKVAAAAEVTCHTTLTGFKWLARAGDGTNEPLVFAYEEALGYSVEPSIRDKDGISAGLRFAKLAAQCVDSGRSIDDHLTNIYTTHGYHLTGQVSSRFDGTNPMADMTNAMLALRAEPPTMIATLEVLDVIDLIDGFQGLQPTDALIYILDGGRVIVRPSGTEPKLKVYLETVADSRERAQARLDELASKVLRSIAVSEAAERP